jgi:anaerobic selenocysteine-containing dehydrogenase
MTETAAMADIVLPATTFLEHDDLYLAGGHTFLQVTRKVIEPYAESHSNHWVIGELARRLGAGHPGFAMSEWELIDATLQRSGHPDAETIYRQHWLDCTQDFATMHFLNGFAHPDRRFRFKPDWSSIGPLYEYLPALPDYCDRIDQASAAKPFRLIAAPARAFLNSSFTETPSSRKVEGRPTLQIHPDDCQQLGITEGCAVRLGNERGSVVVHAKPFAHIPRGVVVVESIWNNASFVEGNGINTLTTAEPGFPNGGATFHDTAIWIEAA